MPPSIQIIGHGLAGAILAETLSAAGLSVSVWEDHTPASSRVAAGLFTPLTGMRFSPTWRLEDAFPVANRFYPELETLTGETFYHPLPMIRLFLTDDDMAEWERKQDSPYAGAAVPPPSYFKNAVGCCEIRGAGWVNLPRMLDALELRRKDRNEWGKTCSADITIRAEGAGGGQHPLWKEAGWRNAHGDILTVHIPGLPQTGIYNFGKFLVPLGNQCFRYGATYHWDRPDPSPMKEGRIELEEALAGVLTLPFKVIDHQAGIRPVARARVPIAGPHPEYPDQWIFNGFGSKGVYLAPWMAEQMRNRLCEGEPLPKETRAARRIQRQRDRDKQKKETKKQ